MEARLSLTPDPDQVGVARRFVRRALTRWDGEHDHEDAVLLTDELVTNAVVHAHSPIVLVVRYDPPFVRLEVRDGSDRLPEPLASAPTEPNGRGLHLVAELAADWGVRAIAGDGKVVWCTLADR
jgi:anti-sigma regulatory factor (Ser/Thr protein kinase)